MIWNNPLLYKKKNVLDKMSWSEISQYSSNGTLKNYASVGDSKEIILNGKVSEGLTFQDYHIRIFIVGFDHNMSVESSAEHRVHWQIGKLKNTLISLSDGQYGNYILQPEGYFSIDSSSDSPIGWEKCQMRTKIMPLIKTALPYELQSVMKSVNKWTDNKGGGTLPIQQPTSTIEYVCLPSEFEIYGEIRGSNINEQYKQKQYEYYENGNPHIYHKAIGYEVGDAINSWLRSPYIGQDGDTTGAFCAVRSGGSIYYYPVDMIFGISPLIFT